MEIGITTSTSDSSNGANDYLYLIFNQKTL